jgi:hypothetical protein
MKLSKVPYGDRMDLARIAKARNMDESLFTAGDKLQSMSNNLPTFGIS